MHIERSPTFTLVIHRDQNLHRKIAELFPMRSEPPSKSSHICKSASAKITPIPLSALSPLQHCSAQSHTYRDASSQVPCYLYTYNQSVLDMLVISQHRHPSLRLQDVEPPRRYNDRISAITKVLRRYISPHEASCIKYQIYHLYKHICGILERARIQEGLSHSD
jgi:hypothetical protein